MRTFKAVAFGSALLGAAMTGSLASADDTGGHSQKTQPNVLDSSGQGTTSKDTHTGDTTGSRETGASRSSKGARAQHKNSQTYGFDLSRYEMVAALGQGGQSSAIGAAAIKR